ncbi:MAG: nuclear transport factor 2 family protein [Proteobacteria bacterium]|nr:nuclear transport factor 2 family protein [Pseudomonadota bacterium]
MRSPTSNFDANALVIEFWRLMAINDFHAVGDVLAQEFTLEWPQSGELIRGARNFALLNAEYPAHGPWRFTINQIVAQGETVVSDVSVTDGVQQGRAISFFTLAGGKIMKIVEFWPEPYAPPHDRAQFTEPLI